MADTPPRRRRRTASTSPRPTDQGEGAPAPDPVSPEQGPSAEGEASSPPPRAPGSGPARAGSLQKRLEDFIAGSALLPTTLGQHYDAHVVAKGAPALAESWANLAKESPPVKRVLENLLTGGAWGGVVISSLAIAMPILANHNLIPLEAAILRPPDVPPPPSAVPQPPPAPSTHVEESLNGHPSPDAPPPPGVTPAPGPAATSLPQRPPAA